MTDGKCICNPGYEFVDAANGFELRSEEDSDADCQPQLAAVCSGSEVLDASGNCIASDCSTQCDSGSGTFDVQAKVCVCAQPDVAVVCDAACRSQQRTLSMDPLTGRLAIYERVANALKLVEYVATGVKNGVAGSTFCKPADELVKSSLTDPELRASSCKLHTVRMQGGKALGVFGLPSQLRSSSGRRLAGSVDPPSVESPIVCLSVGSGMVFDVSPTDYPVYAKDSGLNTNPAFDYGEFRRLKQLMDGGSNITTFIFTFSDPGSYVFVSSNSRRGGQVVVRVMAAGQQCPEAADGSSPILPLQGNLEAFSLESAAFSAPPNWLLIGLTVGVLIVGAGTIVALALYLHRTSLYPVVKQDKSSKEALKADFDSRKTQVMPEEMLGDVIDQPDMIQAAMADQLELTELMDAVKSFNVSVLSSFSEQQNDLAEILGFLRSESKELRELIMRQAPDTAMSTQAQTVALLRAIAAELGTHVTGDNQIIELLDNSTSHLQHLERLIGAAQASAELIADELLEAEKQRVEIGHTDGTLQHFNALCRQTRDCVDAIEKLDNSAAMYRKSRMACNHLVSKVATQADLANGIPPELVQVLRNLQSQITKTDDAFEAVADLLESLRAGLVASRQMLQNRATSAASVIRDAVGQQNPSVQRRMVDDARKQFTTLLTQVSDAFKAFGKASSGRTSSYYKVCKAEVATRTKARPQVAAVLKSLESDQKNSQENYMEKLELLRQEMLRLVSAISGHPVPQLNFQQMGLSDPQGSGDTDQGGNDAVQALTQRDGEETKRVLAEVEKAVQQVQGSNGLKELDDVVTASTNAAELTEEHKKRLLDEYERDKEALGNTMSAERARQSAELKAKLAQRKAMREARRKQNAQAKAMEDLRRQQAADFDDLRDKQTNELQDIQDNAMRELLEHKSLAGTTRFEAELDLLAAADETRTLFELDASTYDFAATTILRDTETTVAQSTIQKLQLHFDRSQQLFINGFDDSEPATEALSRAEAGDDTAVATLKSDLDAAFKQTSTALAAAKSEPNAEFADRIQIQKDKLAEIRGLLSLQRRNFVVQLRTNVLDSWLSRFDGSNAEQILGEFATAVGEVESVHAGLVARLQFTLAEIACAEEHARQLVQAQHHSHCIQLRALKDQVIQHAEALMDDERKRRQALLEWLQNDGHSLSEPRFEPRPRIDLSSYGELKVQFVGSILQSAHVKAKASSLEVLSDPDVSGSVQAALSETADRIAQSHTDVGSLHGAVATVADSLSSHFSEVDSQCQSMLETLHSSSLKRAESMCSSIAQRQQDWLRNRLIASSEANATRLQIICSMVCQQQWRLAHMAAEVFHKIQSNDEAGAVQAQNLYAEQRASIEAELQARQANELRIAQTGFDKSTRADLQTLTASVNEVEAEVARLRMEHEAEHENLLAQLGGEKRRQEATLQIRLRKRQAQRAIKLKQKHAQEVLQLQGKQQTQEVDEPAIEFAVEAEAAKEAEVLKLVEAATMAAEKQAADDTEEVDLQMQNKQSDELSALNEECEAEARGELLRMEEEMQQKLQQATAEKQSAMAALLSAVTDEEELQRIRKEQEEELKQLSSSVGAERARQQAAVQARLEARRQKKLRALRKQHALEQSEQAQQRGLAKAASAHEKALQAESRLLGQLTSTPDAAEQKSDIVELVLQQRHTREYSSLLGAQYAERSADLQNRLNDFVAEKADEKAKLLAMDLEDNELTAALEALDARYTALQADASHQVAAAWEAKHSNEQLELKERQFGELIAAIREFAPNDTTKLRQLEESAQASKAAQEFEVKAAAQRAERIEKARHEKERIAAELAQKEQDEMQKLEEEFEQQLTEQRARQQKQFDARREQMMKQQEELKQQKLRETDGLDLEMKEQIMAEFQADQDRMSDVLDRERIRQEQALQAKLMKRKQRRQRQQQTSAQAELKQRMDGVAKVRQVEFGTHTPRDKPQETPRSQQPDTTRPALPTPTASAPASSRLLSPEAHADPRLATLETGMSRSELESRLVAVEKLLEGLITGVTSGQPLAPPPDVSQVSQPSTGVPQPDARLQIMTALKPHTPVVVDITDRTECQRLDIRLRVLQAILDHANIGIQANWSETVPLSATSSECPFTSQFIYEQPSRTLTVAPSVLTEVNTLVGFAATVIAGIELGDHTFSPGAKGFSTAFMLALQAAVSALMSLVNVQKLPMLGKTETKTFVPSWKQKFIRATRKLRIMRRLGWVAANSEPVALETRPPSSGEMWDTPLHTRVLAYKSLESDDTLRSYLQELEAAVGSNEEEAADDDADVDSPEEPIELPSNLNYATALQMHIQTLTHQQDVADKFCLRALEKLNESKEDLALLESQDDVEATHLQVQQQQVDARAAEVQRCDKHVIELRGKLKDLEALLAEWNALSDSERQQSEQGRMDALMQGVRQRSTA